MNVDMLLEMDRHFRERKGFDAIRPEARLILLLKKHGPLSVKQAMSFSQISYRGFYAVLGRLVKSGMITMSADDEDRRVRRLALAPMAMAGLDCDEGTVSSPCGGCHEIVD